MKTLKLKIKLFPDEGKIIPGAFVFINKQMHICEDVTATAVTVMLGNELIEFPKNACHLAKYFCFANSHRIKGELSFQDYDKVSDGDVIIGEVLPKPTPIQIGDKVQIIKPELHDLEKCIRCMYEGVVVRCSSRTFDIAIPDAVITVYRNQIKLINKPNYRNIIKYIKTL